MNLSPVILARIQLNQENGLTGAIKSEYPDLRAQKSLVGISRVTTKFLKSFS